MKPFEIFMTGTHTDTLGGKTTWTEADLDTISQKYAERAVDAPIVVGHPDDSSPAFGWISSIYRQGQKLFAVPKDVVAEFSDAVKQKLYKYVSISLRPDKTLRHIGFLGGMPPAVKGLAAVEFADKTEKCTSFEFMEYQEAGAFNIIGQLFQSMRDYFIEKEGKEKTDKLLSQWDVDNLKRIQPDNKNSVNFNEGASMTAAEIQAMQDENTRLTAANTDLTAKNKSFSEAVTTKDAEIVTLKADKAKGEKEARDREHNSFCDSLGARLKPADRSAVLSQLEIMHQASTGNFAEGAVKPIDTFKKMLLNAGPVISFAEVALKDKVPKTAGNAGERLAALTADLMQKEPTLNYAEAFKRIQVGNPDLANEYAVEIRG